MPRESITNEVSITEQVFTHKCFGKGTRMKAEPYEFKFTCVQMPDGRKGCKCPMCQTTFILKETDKSKSPS